MATTDPFDFFASNATRRVPGLPGQASGDPDSPLARMAAGKPAADNPVIRVMEKNRTGPMSEWWAGKSSPVGRVMDWHSEAVNGAVKSALAPYSAAMQGLVPKDLMRGVNVATEVAAWASKGTSVAALPTGVTARPWALGAGTNQTIMDSLSGLPAGAKSPVWQAMMGGQVAAAMTPLETIAKTMRSVSSLTQMTGLQSVIEAMSSQAFPPGWVSPFKIKPASVPLSNLGTAATDYVAAARRVHETLGVDAIVEDDTEFTPTADDTAYQALTVLAPDVAALVDEQADGIITYFWPRHIVRNSLAVTAFALVEALYVYILLVLPLSLSSSIEQDQLALGTYGLHALEGFGASMKAYRRIAPSQENPTND